MRNGGSLHSTKAKGIDRRKNIYKGLVQEAVSEKDVIKALDVLKKKSLEGDLTALRLLLEYTLGKPVDKIELEQVEQRQFVVEVVESGVNLDGKEAVKFD